MPSSERINREGRKLLLGAQARENRSVKSRPASAGKKWRPTPVDAAMGAVLGVLSGVALSRLGLIGMIPLLRGDHAYAIAGLVGLVLGISRLRALVLAGAALAALGVLVVGYGPFVKPLANSVVRRDPLRRADAVVVLSSDIFRDGQMTQAAQIRLLRGYEVIREGYAPRLVITRLRPPKESYEPVIEKQLRRLKLEFPIDETLPVGNTHDEAIEVGRLVRDHAWREIILVSDPTHLRRAGAVFEKQGLKVLCTPCADRDYDLENLSTPGERIDAFRDWLWEAIGYEVYKRNGWI